MAELWSRFPSWWIRQGHMGYFKGGEQAGDSLAALKCYVGVTLMADYKSMTADVSVSDLERLTGLSRPKVVAGIAMAGQGALLHVTRNGNRANHYQLMGHPGDSYWAKLPNERLRAALPDLPNRGTGALAAVKIYLYLVSIRPNTSSTVSAKYSTLRDNTMIQQKHIRVGLDLLFEHRLIAISTVSGDGRRRHNEYTLFGLGP